MHVMDEKTKKCKTFQMLPEIKRTFKKHLIPCSCAAFPC